VPIDEKPQRKAEERHQKVREWVRQHRLKNKNKFKTVTNNLEQSAEVSSSSSDVTSTMNTELLVVKLPKLATKKRTRTRVNRANTKHRRTIADLSGKNEQLNRKIKTVSKLYQRLVNMVKKTQPNESIPSTSTSVENTPSTSTPVGFTPRKRTTDIREKFREKSKKNFCLQM
jgi:hypothetical protein